MKVLVISLEFVDPIFSGNGVAGRSLIRSLLSGSDNQIFAVCGCPQDASGKCSRKLESFDFAKSLQIPEKECGRLSGVAVFLPRWFRTDICSSYSEFCQIACSIDEIKGCEADICIAIDWTGSLVFRSLQTDWERRIPCMYFVFCCYTFLTNISDQDKEFYELQEFQSMESSSLTIAICGGDKMKLETLASSKDVKILLPPLRIDVQRIVSEKSAGPLQRRFITCCLRLHPSKNVEVFVEAVALLKPILQKMDLIPVLCGAPADADYADACRKKLRSNFPGSIIYEEFLNAKDMVELFRETKLNVHTALYEAYGMTIVEAAAGGKLHSASADFCLFILWL